MKLELTELELDSLRSLTSMELQTLVLNKMIYLCLLCIYLLCLIADPYALMAYLIEELYKIGILFIHAIEPRIGSNTEVQEVDETKFTLKPFREAFKGTFIGAGG